MRSAIPARLAPTLTVALLALLALLAAAPAAFGHAAFLGSDPQPGVRLEGSPPRIALTFTEPLNRELARAELVRVDGGDVAVKTVSSSARRLVLRPAAALERGAYRVDWHSVSTEDGHALEGSFSFGVRTAAASGGHSLEQSPLARDGWLRVGARVLLYAALLLFAGALLLRVVLGARGDDSWLTGRRLEPLEGADLERAQVRERAVTTDLGAFAVGAAALAALVEAVDAAQGFSPAGLSDYLLANVAGVGRVGVVGFALLALALWQRSPRIAAAAVASALGAVAASGHAGSASPRLLTILNDWVHLLSGAVWLGGIALIVLVWGPALRRSERDLRMMVARRILPEFGRVALPAFLIVSATGVASLLVQLGSVDELWRSSYGRVLLIKVALVGLLAGASWWHAVRLRPRMLAPVTSSEQVERRHWRVLRAEPMLGVAIVAAVALLATFPLPPRQLGEADEALASLPACDPCPLRRPARDELAVAENAGRLVVAGWLRGTGERVTGTVRVLTSKNRPAGAPITVLRARQSSCGPGCRRFSTTGDVVRVAVRDGERRHVADLPARWSRHESARARGLLRRAQTRMRGLRSVRQTEKVTSGPGSFARTDYRLQAPNRLAYVTGGRTETVVVGRAQWFRAPGITWQRGEYAGGGAFSTRRWFRWSSYARDVRLLREWRQDGRPLAQLALFDPGTPVFLRLTVALDDLRVLRERMTTGGHFTKTIYSHFNEPARIEPPEVGDER
ncbi:MAG: copper resistance protein CopC/CopD [Solirubrobacterales bacterium]|nr:copper resistance protein CopC/CopD [Solirubrobacterales bacterium]